MKTCASKNHLLRVLFALPAWAALAACTGTGSGDLSLNGSTDGAMTVGITKIQGDTAAQWITDGSGKVYTKANAVQIDGTCSRGISQMIATVNGASVSETASCTVNGTFTWQKTFAAVTAAAGDTYDIVLKAAKDDGGVIDNVSTSKSIVVDTTAPTAPSINAAVTDCSIGTPYICSGGNLTVTGSWSGAEDVTSLIFPSGVSATYPTATTFNVAVTLTEGETRTITLQVKDRAGNISGDSSISLSYAPNVRALATGVSGGTNGLAGGPTGSAASMFGNIGTMNASYVGTETPPTGSPPVMVLGPLGIGAEKIKNP